MYVMEDGRNLTVGFTGIDEWVQKGVGELWKTMAWTAWLGEICSVDGEQLLLRGRAATPTSDSRSSCVPKSTQTEGE